MHAPRLLALLLFVGGCASEGVPEETVGPAPDADSGALVRVTLEGTVGVLLDELPEDVRDEAAAEVLRRDEVFWRTRAERLNIAMRLRLGYRTYFQLLEGGRGQQLPLPPPSVWSFTFDEAGASRRVIDGHDVVAVDYRFESVLLAGVDDPAQAEPALGRIGGTWDEPFVLPLDPEHLFQRTGYACVRELGAETVVDSENALRFYDHTCEAEAPGLLNCHDGRPDGTWPESCDEALRSRVGRVQTALRFERLPWDARLADEVRVGDPPATADLRVLPDGLTDHRVVWRYFDVDHCALQEGCVGGAGWRRLLMFDASLENLGAASMHVGAVEGSALADHRVYEYSSCHEHEHFRFYGDFELDYGTTAMGDKQAFCLLSTTRYGNHEAFPLTHPYIDCNTQGIAAGWGDDYYAGIDCQWIDVTEVPTWDGPVDAMLRFTANPERFLCEGVPMFDDAGDRMFEPTEHLDSRGDVIDRPMCELSDGWADNNVGEAPVTLAHGGGLITTPCIDGELSPARNCGFSPVRRERCTPGATMTITCTPSEGMAPRVVRICEVSSLYDAPIPCLFEQALANVAVASEASTFTVECPAERSVRVGEVGGEIALFDGKLIPDAADAGEIFCEIE